MRKAYTALMSFEGQLLTVAGRGIENPTNPSPQAKYSNARGWVYTNEHHIFNRERGEQHSSLACMVCVYLTNKMSTKLKQSYH